MAFDPISPEHLKFRSDPNDPRLGELTKAVPTLSLPDWSAFLRENPCTHVLAGYPDSEGIALNGGRPGAEQAPKSVRTFLYRQTPHLNLASQPRLVDLGDLTCGGADLAERHRRAEAYAFSTLQAGRIWLSVGGGHDYGFPDAAAFCESTIKNGKRPLVLNFDAHLDVRPVDRGLTSGTPFFRLLERYPDAIDLAQIGVQAQCNSRQHLQWCRERKVRVLTFDDWQASRLALTDFLMRHLDDWLLRPRPCFISVDIDGFSSAYAPGASQVFPTGMSANDFLQALELLCARLNVRGLGVYEVSPPFDRDHATSRLAAIILHRVLFATAVRSNESV